MLFLFRLLFFYIHKLLWSIYWNREAFIVLVLIDIKLIISNFIHSWYCHHIFTLGNASGNLANIWWEHFVFSSSILKICLLLNFFFRFTRQIVKSKFGFCFSFWSLRGSWYHNIFLLSLWQLIIHVLIILFFIMWIFMHLLILILEKFV